MTGAATLRLSALTALLLATSGSALAQDHAEVFPLRVPVPGGEVIHANAGAKHAHDTIRFASARRAGNLLYLSGVIIGRRPNEGSTVADFKAQTRRGFDWLKLNLSSSCATFADVAKINSFHVWQGPDFSGSRDEQFAAFSEVMGEYIQAPYPAWTAVGTTGLLGEGGIVEIEMVAYVPDRACDARLSRGS